MIAARETQLTFAILIVQRPRHIRMRTARAILARHPEALVVFVETDHSPKPVEPLPDLPWLRSFLSVAV